MEKMLVQTILNKNGKIYFQTFPLVSKKLIPVSQSWPHQRRPASRAVRLSGPE